MEEFMKLTPDNGGMEKQHFDTDFLEFHMPKRDVPKSGLGDTDPGMAGGHLNYMDSFADQFSYGGNSLYSIQETPGAGLGRVGDGFNTDTGRGSLSMEYMSPAVTGSQSRTNSITIQPGSYQSRRTSIIPIAAVSPSLESSSYNEFSYNSSMDLRSPSVRTSPASPGTPSSFSSKTNMSKEERMKRRREFHNAVERRRRDLIKEKIKELGSLVPPSLLMSDYLPGKETKPNKNMILKKTVEYVAHLHQVLTDQEKRRELLENRLRELGASDSPLERNSVEPTPDATKETPESSKTTGDKDDHQLGIENLNEFLNTNPLLQDDFLTMSEPVEQQWMY